MSYCNSFLLFLFLFFSLSLFLSLYNIKWSIVSGLTQGVFSIASKIREAVDDFEQEQQNFIKEKPASEKDNARGIEDFFLSFSSKKKIYIYIIIEIFF